MIMTEQQQGAADATATAATKFPILNLPYELKRRTASFLSSRDAVQMSLSCKTLLSSLSLACLPSRNLFHRLDWTASAAGDNDTGDQPFEAFQIPRVVSRDRVHAITLLMVWHDQGWGNHKGKVWVIAKKKKKTKKQQQQQQPPKTSESSQQRDQQDQPSRETANAAAVSGNEQQQQASASASAPDSTTASAGGDREEEEENEEFDGGRIVYESQIAPARPEPLKITFTPSSSEEEDYYFWYRVGGGGGHQLFLLEGRLRTVIFDDPDRSFSKNYRILLNTGVLLNNNCQHNRIHNTTTTQTSTPSSSSAFYPKMMLSVCKSLRSQMNNGSNPDVELKRCLQEYDIPVNESSLRALEEIVSNDLEERARLTAERSEQQQREQRERRQRQRQQQAGRGGRGGAPGIRIAHHHFRAGGPMPRGFRVEVRQQRPAQQQQRRAVGGVAGPAAAAGAGQQNQQRQQQQQNNLGAGGIRIPFPIPIPGFNFGGFQRGQQQQQRGGGGAGAAPAGQQQQQQLQQPNQNNNQQQQGINNNNDNNGAAAGADANEPPPPPPGPGFEQIGPDNIQVFFGGALPAGGGAGADGDGDDDDGEHPRVVFQDEHGHEHELQAEPIDNPLEISNEIMMNAHNHVGDPDQGPDDEEDQDIPMID